MNDLSGGSLDCDFPLKPEMGRGTGELAQAVVHAVLPVKLPGPMMQGVYKSWTMVNPEWNSKMGNLRGSRAAHLSPGDRTEAVQCHLFLLLCLLATCLHTWIPGEITEERPIGRELWKTTSSFAGAEHQRRGLPVP